MHAMPIHTGRRDVPIEPVLRSGAMRKLDGVLRALADKDVIVTFVGESGAGKEVLAQRVHQLSGRRGPFIPINCAAIPEPLFESELFGHERGAFTDASERAKGKIEAAAGGTLFLDEIGEMPLGMQAKLLRFLEHRRFMRVGGTTKIEADVRLVCATLRPLVDEVRGGRFRADLCYRISAFSLSVPPLRDRVADLPALIDQLLVERAAKHGVTPPHLGRRVRTALLAHDWPGNVRELRNVIDMLCVLHQGRRVSVHDLPQTVLSAPGDATMPRELTVSLDEPLEAITQRVIDAALRLEGGRRTRAARRLGISVRTIQRHVGAKRSARG